MATATKKTIYIDPDDEITAVIDKMRLAKESIIALVIPKRASVFTSVVNMKLLKRSADQSGKSIVLITSSNEILPLAGNAGIFVATSPTSKPYIPSDPVKISTEETATIDNSEKQPIEVNNSPAVEPDEAVLEVDNVPKVETKTKKTKKTKKNKLLKIPNFNKFRLIFGAIIVAVILLVGFSVWAFAIAPKAVVTLKTETSAKNLKFNFSADSAVKEADYDKKILPATLKEIKKTETEKVASTGQKDKGNKASGTVELMNCSDNDVVVPAGTGLSASGYTFITQANISLGAGNFTSSGVCKTSSPKKDVDVIAQSPGDKYNLKSRQYAVSGFPGIKATGSDMTGGTSNIVKVVSATDVTNAKNKITERQQSVSDELKSSLLAQGLVVLPDTYNVSNGEFVATPAIDTEASEVIVTVEVNYSMIGVSKSDLNKLIEAEAYSNGIDKAKQSILKDGLDSAVFNTLNKTKTSIDTSIEVNIEAGPQIDNNEIINEIKNKKSGEAEQILLKRPGIKEASVKTSPFSTIKVPGKASKITIIVNGASNSSNDQQP